MKKASERAALVLVALVALVVVAFLAASMASERRRNAVVNRFEKPAAVTAYEELTRKLAPHQTAAEQEGEGVASGAERGDSSGQEAPWGSDVTQALEGYKRLFDSLDERQRQAPNMKTGNRWDELTDSEREELRRYLGENQDFLEQIREMARAGGPVAALDFSQGYAMELPHLAKMREFARLLCRDAFLQAQGGNLDMAVEDLIAGMQLGDALACEPILISQLVRIATYDIVNQGLGEAFAPGQLPPEAVDSLVAQLAQADNRQAFADSLSAESLFGLAEFERLRDGGMAVNADLLGNSSTGGLDQTLLRLYASPLARPFFNNDEATYAEIMGQMSEVAVLPYYEAQPTLTQIGQDIDNLSFTRVLSRTLLPALTRVSQAQARHESILDTAQMGLLLEQYYVDNGTYPDSLDAIASRLGGAVPVDPFTGQAYVYKPSGGSFLLYGVGMNLTDDGGRHDVTDGDIVWRGREADD